jgi:hypothetical protein
MWLLLEFFLILISIFLLSLKESPKLEFFSSCANSHDYVNNRENLIFPLERCRGVSQSDRWNSQKLAKNCGDFGFLGNRGDLGESEFLPKRTHSTEFGLNTLQIGGPYKLAKCPPRGNASDVEMVKIMTGNEGQPDRTVMSDLCSY